jgi:hypothetical protein
MLLNSTKHVRLSINETRSTNTERIRIDRESEAIHDLILWLDEPAGI